MSGTPGVKPSPEQLREESHMEAKALIWDAIDSDPWEFATVRTIHDTLLQGLAKAGPNAPGRSEFEAVARMVADLVAHDLKENARHRGALRALTVGVA